MSTWNQDTTVTSVDPEPHAEGAERTFSADFGAGWTVGGGINGGYQMAVLGRALSATVPGKPDPLTLTTHFTGPAVAGPAMVSTRVVRNGGSVATLAGTIEQNGAPTITALGTWGSLADLPPEVETTATPFELAPVEECVSTALAPEEIRAMAPLMERFDLRLDPSCIGWSVGQPSGRGLLKGWFRLPEDEPDPIVLLLALDALPPVTMDLGRIGWAPTMEHTAHVRALPAPGWLRVGQWTRNVAGGMFEEDCEIWDSAGRLVAQSRQLARLPR